MITFKAKAVVEDYLYIKQKTGPGAPHLELLKLVHIPLPFGSRGTIWEGSLMEPEDETDLDSVAKATKEY